MGSLRCSHGVTAERFHRACEDGNISVGIRKEEPNVQWGTHACLTCTVLTHSGGLHSTPSKIHSSLRKKRKYRFWAQRRHSATLEGPAAVEPATERANQKTLNAEIKQMRMNQRNSRRQARGCSPMHCLELSSLLIHSDLGFVLEWEVFPKYC